MKYKWRTNSFTEGAMSGKYRHAFIGPPRATPECTEQQLVDAGMVGVYYDDENGEVVSSAIAWRDFVRIKSNQKMIFAISEDKGTLILGIPEAAWEFMRSGRTHTFDLRQFGMNIKVVVFGCETQAEGKAMLNTTQNTIDVSQLDIGFGGVEV